MNNNNKIKLFSIILFFIVLNLLVLYKDSTPLTYDAEGYFEESVKYFQILNQEPKNIFLVFFEEKYDIETRPPVFMLVSTPFYWTFGITEDVARITNFLFYIIIIIFTYLIGKELGNKKIGLLGSIILSTIPLFFGFLRMYYTDFAAATFITMSFYFLIKNKYFQERKFSIYLGIILGFGLLTKKLFILVIIGPLIYQIFSSKKNKIFFKNISIILILVLLISAPWYLSQKSTIFFWLNESSNISLSKNDIDVFSFNGFNYYLFAMKNMILHDIMFFVFIFSFIGLFFIKNKHKQNLILWIIIPYFILSLVANKVPRYFLGLLPIISLIIALILYRIRYKFIRILILLIFILQFVLISYSSVGSIIVPDIKSQNFDEIYDTIGLLHPQNHDWKINKLMDEFSTGQTILFTSMQGFVYSQISQKIMLNNLDLKLKTPFEVASTGYKSCGNRPCLQEDYNAFILESDIIIDSDWLEFEEEERIVTMNLKKTLMQNINKFLFIKEINLPNNTTLKIYKRI